MSDSDSRFLFAYGTLMSTATGDLGRDMRLRLRREARVVGPATVAGRLYDLGRYPGLVASTDAGDLVHGEVVELMDPEATLPWLDEYEGAGRGPQAVEEYIRSIVSVQVSGARALAAWIYLFNRPVIGVPRVRSGRWIARK